jgi:hypothetical protein
VNGQGPEQFDFRKEIHIQAQTAVFQLTDVLFKSI